MRASQRGSILSGLLTTKMMDTTSRGEKLARRTLWGAARSQTTVSVSVLTLIIFAIASTSSSR
jgi:hypothetical protein